jgi:hypothetical protein
VADGQGFVWKFVSPLEMSVASRLEGAPRIHGDFPSSESMSATPPLQNTGRGKGGRHRKAGKTFLRNHAEGIASIDMFVVPTVLSYR